MQTPTATSKRHHPPLLSPDPRSVSPVFFSPMSGEKTGGRVTITYLKPAADNTIDKNIIMNSASSEDRIRIEPALGTIDSSTTPRHRQQYERHHLVAPDNTQLAALLRSPSVVNMERSGLYYAPSAWGDFWRAKERALLFADEEDQLHAAATAPADAVVVPPQQQLSPIKLDKGDDGTWDFTESQLGRLHASRTHHESPFRLSPRQQHHQQHRTTGGASPTSSQDESPCDFSRSTSPLAEKQPNSSSKPPKRRKKGGEEQQGDDEERLVHLIQRQKIAEWLKQAQRQHASEVEESKEQLEAMRVALVEAGESLENRTQEINQQHEEVARREAGVAKREETLSVSIDRFRKELESKRKVLRHAETQADAQAAEHKWAWTQTEREQNPSDALLRVQQGLDDREKELLDADAELKKERRKLQEREAALRRSEEALVQREESFLLEVQEHTSRIKKAKSLLVDDTRDLDAKVGDLEDHEDRIAQAEEHLRREAERMEEKEQGLKQYEADLVAMCEEMGKTEKVATLLQQSAKRLRKREEALAKAIPVTAISSSSDAVNASVSGGESASSQKKDQQHSVRSVLSDIQQELTGINSHLHSVFNTMPPTSGSTSAGIMSKLHLSTGSHQSLSFVDSGNPQQQQQQGSPSTSVIRDGSVSSSSTKRSPVSKNRR